MHQKLLKGKEVCLQTCSYTAESCCFCREHSQFLEEVRAHVLHNGPKPGAGQMLSRATLASRSSGDLAGHDDVAAREDSSASGAGPSAPADAPESRGVPVQLHAGVRES